MNGFIIKIRKVRRGNSRISSILYIYKNVCFGPNAFSNDLLIFIKTLIEREGDVGQKLSIYINQQDGTTQPLNSFSVKI